MTIDKLVLDVLYIELGFTMIYIDVKLHKLRDLMIFKDFYGREQTKDKN